MTKEPLKTIYSPPYGDATKKAINQIAHILQRNSDQPCLQILPLPQMLPQSHNENHQPPEITSIPAPALRVEPILQPTRVQTQE